MQVLIVDRSEAFRDTLSNQVRLRGHQPIVCATDEDGLRALEQYPNIGLAIIETDPIDGNNLKLRRSLTLEQCVKTDGIPIMPTVNSEPVQRLLSQFDVESSYKGAIIAGGQSRATNITQKVIDFLNNGAVIDGRMSQNMQNIAKAIPLIFNPPPLVMPTPPSGWPDAVQQITAPSWPKRFVAMLGRAKRRLTHSQGDN